MILDASPRAALRAIAATGLPGAPNAEIGDEPLHVREFLCGISRERLTGLAVLAAEQGTLQLPAADLNDLFERHEDQLALDLRLEQVLAEVAGTLESARIPYRALKGPVLAHTSYPDPALRSFGDIDVLVPTSSFDMTIELLRPLEFHRRFLEPRAGFDSRFSKGACLEGANGLEVDLHRTLAPGPYGTLLARSDLFSRPAQRFVLGAQSVDGLDRETAFVHACFHAALGDDPPRLVALRDIAELFKRGFDERVVVDVIDSTGCVAVLQRAFWLLRAELGVPVTGDLADWVDRCGLSRLDRVALRTYAGPGRSYARQAVVSLWVMPSMRERFAYVFALAFPNRDYLRARDETYARRISRGVQVAGERSAR
jgi:hypothetical protein